MKKISLLLFLVLATIQFNLSAERINISGLDVPDLIITEVRPDTEATAYVELTNVGTTDIDLSTIHLHSVHYNTRLDEVTDSIIDFNRTNAATDATLGKVFLEGTLAPGKSTVICTVWDANDANGSGVPRHNTAVAQIADQFVFKNEETNEYGWIDMPQWQCYGKDSSYTKTELLRWDYTAGYLIQWHFEDSETGEMDSTYIDQFNFFHHPDALKPTGAANGNMKGYEMFSIAGIYDAMETSTMVRKSTVNQGNLDWDQSRGTDSNTSEWLVLPRTSTKQAAFTTVGSHGDYSLVYSVKDPQIIVLDEGAKTISIPWNIARGDSLASYFNLGEGMAWSYENNTSFEDSAAFLVRTGDKFALYAVGSELESVEFTIDVRDAEADLAQVFPTRRLTTSEELVYDENTGLVIDTLFTSYWPTGFVYSVTDGLPVDSITNVGFATRVDTLFKYLDKPDGAQIEMIFVDGNTRVDVMFGDKLKVTSKDGSASKEYVLSVNDHVKKSNALLSTVTWPDVVSSDYRRWLGDTLPDFTELKTDYIVELVDDATQIPAFQFITQDVRARISIDNATDVDGNLAQRTTSVTVFAEDDTTTLTYNFTFQKKNAAVQPNNAEPFISEMIWGASTQGWAAEIYNPGTERLDLSQYMYVKGTKTQTWQEAVATLNVSEAQFATGSGELKIYSTHYCPSKRWASDASSDVWLATPDEDNPYVGPGILKDDGITDSRVDGQDVWVMCTGTNATDADQIKLREESDFIFRGVNETLYAWDSTKILHRFTPVWNNPRSNLFLLKILNDSITDGTMKVTDASQYELIDRFEAIGDSVAGRKCSGNGWSLMRKPSVSQGNIETIGGGTSTADNSEWIVRQTNDNRNLAITANVGIHTMDPVTNYLSTVTSLYFVVTDGYDGDGLTITGDITQYTPTTIASLLDKADESQVFEFVRGATTLTADQALAADDELNVTSGDGNSTTKYTLVDAPLSDDTSLSAKAGSGLSVAGTVVSGLTLSTSLSDFVASLETAESSLLNVVDANGALQPLKMHDIEGDIVDVLVNSNVYIQVIAANNDQEVYSLDFGIANNEAYLFSNVLTIDQDSREIVGVPAVCTAPSILNMLFASTGATVKVIDKASFERVEGFLNVDDEIEVTAADGITKVIYTLKSETANSIASPRAKELVSIEIYPNPVSNVLHISGAESASADVYSLSGAKILSQSVYGNQLDLSAIAPGVYMLRVTDVNGQSSVKRFLKK